MEVEVSGSELIGGARIERARRPKTEKDRVRVKIKALEAVLEECQRAIQLISSTGCVDGDEAEEEEETAEASLGPCRDREADELCDLLKSGVECPDFLEKLESAQASIPQNMIEEGNSWEMVNENETRDGGNIELDHEEYVLIRQEDIAEGIACFTATYLLSLKQTKDLTPTQLQEALSKTFSVKKKKGKLRKAWDGSKVIYNVASWGATAMGIYQNPALLTAASAAFWTSCRVISNRLF